MGWFGGLFKVFTKLLGGKKPKVSTAAVTEVKDDAAKSKTARASLYGTTGGVQGMELNPDQVKKRDSLLGN